MERGNGESDNGKPGNDKRDNGKRGWQTAERIFVASIMRLIPERHDTHEHHDGASGRLPIQHLYDISFYAANVRALLRNDGHWVLRLLDKCKGFMVTRGCRLFPSMPFSWASSSPESAKRGVLVQERTGYYLFGPRRPECEARANRILRQTPEPSFSACIRV